MELNILSVCASQTKKSTQPELNSKRQNRVIVCDDEKPLLEIYRTLLKSKGFQPVGSFEDGEDLVSFLQNNKDPLLEPQIAILDYRMPRMNGLEAAKLVRALRPGLKIVLASAYDVPSEERQGYFDAVLKKPFSGKQLIEVLVSIAIPG